MKLVITIDTEEDNWGSYRPSGWTLHNIEMIQPLQDLFDEFDARPTYLITYPVATDEKAISLLKGIADSGRCEIGTHCHPWNTPPYDEETNPRNSMLCNLPPDLQHRKIAALHSAIVDNFGIQPVSFRAGRWGYGQTVAESLCRLGYLVDTSVIALTDWRYEFGPDYSGVFSTPYRFNADAIFKSSSNGRLLEVPASVGYLQNYSRLRHDVHTVLSKRPFNKMRLIGLLYKMNILNKAWLSPENSDAETMVRLARQFKKDGHRIVNMFFHSSSLKAGITPFTRTHEDEQRILGTIRSFFEYVRSEGIESIKLQDAKGVVR